MNFFLAPKQILLSIVSQRNKSSSHTAAINSQHVATKLLYIPNQHGATTIDWLIYEPSQSKLTSHLGSEAEGIKPIMFLIFWSITSNAREQPNPTGRSGIDDGVLNGAIMEPACITPIQTLGPCCRRRYASFTFCWVLEAIVYWLFRYSLVHRAILIIIFVNIC